MGPSKKTGQQPQSQQAKASAEQSGTTPQSAQTTPSQIKKSIKSLRVLVVIGGLASAMFLVKGWWDQSHSPIVCKQGFTPLAENNNGYIQINIVAPHQIEQEFNAEAFLYYPDNQSPPPTIRLIRGARGAYAPSISETQLVPWSAGRATPKPVPFDIPTPGVSLRNFPFDSRTFDFSLGFTPAKRPSVVIIRNLSTDFIPACRTLSSKWDGTDTLTTSIQFRRNPFVQYTAVIVGLAALIFGILLGRLRSDEDLARATASYFFSLWSVRSLITPAGLSYSTLLDFWFMAVAVVVLFVVAWRFTGVRASI